RQQDAMPLYTSTGTFKLFGRNTSVSLIPLGWPDWSLKPRRSSPATPERCAAWPTTRPGGRGYSTKTSRKLLEEVRSLWRGWNDEWSRYPQESAAPWLPC